MLRIRLTRRGAKKKPFYRVVVAEKFHARDGRFLEIVGTYNPGRDPATVVMKLDRVDHWMKFGAQPSDTVKALIARVRQAETATQTATQTETQTETTA